MENREAIIEKLLTGFYKDLNISAAPLATVDEKIDFVKTLSEMIREIINDDYLTFDHDDFLNERLLKKYRHKMVPFVKSGLIHFFLSREYNQQQVFKKLGINDTPVLKDTDFEDILWRYAVLLQHIETRLYLLPPDNAASAPLPQVPTQINKSSESSSKFPGWSRSRQALMLYYTYQVLGITRYDTSVATMAKFSHALLGWAYSDINNSELYKLLKKAPLIRQDDMAFEDLKFVRAQFEMLGNKTALELIDKEIASFSRRK